MTESEGIMDTAIKMPATENIEDQLAPLTQGAQGLVITDRTEHELAQSYLQDTVKLERAVVDLFADVKTQTNKAHKAACAAEKRLLTPILETRRGYTLAIGRYETEAKQRAEEERRRLEAEARKAEEERLLAEAEAAETNGDKELATEIMEEAASVPTPIVHVEPELAKTKGVVSRTTWSAEVTSFRELIAFVSENPQFENLLQPNGPALNAMARGLKENMKVEGVRAVPSVNVGVSK